MSAIRTLTTQFDCLLNATRPPIERIEAAQECHPLVRDYLESLDSFPTISPHSRLVGSYAQKMSVGDVKDVDILVRVDGDPLENEPNAKELLQNLKKALDGLPGALGLQGTSEFNVNAARRSVHVYFKEKDFHLDIVPCIAPNGMSQALYVPDRGFEKWILSHPLGYIEKLNSLNNDHKKKVKKVGRLFKLYIQQSMIYMRPKSYWLGSMLLNLIDEKGFDHELSLGELFHWVVNELYLKYDHLKWTDTECTPNIPDPVLDHNVSHNWSRNDFESFLRHLDHARKQAKRALEADSIDGAVKYWQSLFGDAFPGSVEEEVTRAASAFIPGAAVVFNSCQPAPKIITPVPRTQFHGN